MLLNFGGGAKGRVILRLVIHIICEKHALRWGQASFRLFCSGSHAIKTTHSLVKTYVEFHKG